MVRALRTARWGVRLFQSQLEPHHEIAPRCGLPFERGDDGRTFLGRHPILLEDVHDFLLFGLRFLHDLLFFAPALVEEVLGVTPGRQVTTQPHRHGARGNLRQPRRDDNVRGGQRARDARGQSKRHRQPIRHANHHVADGVAPGEMLFDVFHRS